MIRETAYHEVTDSQSHFRSILDAVARPGRINILKPVRLTPPPPLNRASVLVAFALLDEDTTFAIAGRGAAAESYLAANTQARPSRIGEAAFLFANGQEGPEILESVSCGSLLYPDTGATLILQIKAASNAPISDAVRLTIEGPGIRAIETIFVRGLNPELLLAIQARNVEFPLGLDTIFTLESEGGDLSVVGLPRTTRFAWAA